MSAAALLSRLDLVKERGPGKWTARCPAHDDGSPSLSILEKDDGRVLVHDFAGCSVEEILAAVGLDFDALFPPRALGDHFKRERQPFNAHDVLRCLNTEILVAAVLASDMCQGKKISTADKDRLFVASARISSARELINAN